MKSENAIRDKSRAFAIRCVNLYKFLKEEQGEYIMSKQVLRSGTSIGANIAEGIFAQSRPDFAAKLSIAQKEAGETAYWLDILRETDYITASQFESLNNDCNEILKLLQTITKTLYNKLQSTADNY